MSSDLARAVVDATLRELKARLFIDSAKLTLVVRFPDLVDADIVVSADDDLEAVESVVRKRRTQAADADERKEGPG